VVVLQRAARALEDVDNLPAPEVIAREIVEDLTAALLEFEAVASALEAAESGRDN
jgi:type I restriction enzyme M protein